MSDYWEVSRRNIKRSMELEIPEGTEILILRFNQERVWLEWEQGCSTHHRVPVSWGSAVSELDDPEYWEDFHKRHPKRPIDGVQLFIGPLVNSIREFERWVNDNLESESETDGSYEETDESADYRDEDETSWELASEGAVEQEEGANAAV